MKFFGEIFTEATQSQIWDVLADLNRMPDWIDAESLYIPPTSMRLINDFMEVGGRWEMVGEDDSILRWQVNDWQPGLSLSFYLYEMENHPLPVSLFTHRIDLIMAELGTLIEWQMEVNLLPLDAWLQPADDGRISRFRAWIFLREISDQFQQMIDESLENLVKLVEGNNDSNNADDPEGWHSETETDQADGELDEASMDDPSEEV